MTTIGPEDDQLNEAMAASATALERTALAAEQRAEFYRAEGEKLIARGVLWQGRADTIRETIAALKAIAAEDAESGPPFADPAPVVEAPAPTPPPTPEPEPKPAPDVPVEEPEAPQPQPEPVAVEPTPEPEVRREPDVAIDIDVQRKPVAVTKTILPPTDGKMPAHLREMPSANTGGPFTNRFKAALNQRVVYDAAAKYETVVAQEIERDLEGVFTTDGKPFDGNKISAYLREMVATGIVSRTGQNRYGSQHKPGTGGRVSVEYAVVPGKVKTTAPSAAAAPVAEASPVVEAPKPTVRLKPSAERANAVLTTVRDFAVKQTEAFGPSDVEKATEIPRLVALEALKILAVRGVVSDESIDDSLPMFEYRKPQEAGKGAEMDRQRSRAAASSPSSSGSQPVAGTGKPLGVTNPDVRKLIQDAQAAGASVTHASNGHFAVEKNGMRRTLISATPRGTRSVMNDRARLRREGLSV